MIWGTTSLRAAAGLLCNPKDVAAGCGVWILDWFVAGASCRQRGTQVPAPFKPMCSPALTSLPAASTKLTNCDTMDMRKTMDSASARWRPGAQVVSGVMVCGERSGMPEYHFITGLPRSGSTLLAALLKQNPAFHAGISSPIGPVFDAVLAQFSAGNEFAPLVADVQRKRMLRAIVDAYYAEMADRQVIFDTNRVWAARMPLLKDQFPDTKVIACVRNVAWVMDSLERIYRDNPYELTRLFNDNVERDTVYSRVDTLGQRNRLVGFAWTALKEAFYGEHAKSLLLVDFDLLVSAPARVMKLIYQFLEEPPFTHDFENIAFDSPKFDAALGLRGLHRVRPNVSMPSRHTILPPDLFAQYAKLAFWHDTTGSQANVIAITPPVKSKPQ